MENKEHGRLINMISNKLKRLADENLVHENVTVEQVRIMSIIFHSGGEIGQKEIEKEIGVRRSTVTSAMQILEKKGYIERIPHPNDSRAKIVKLTPEGTEKNRKLKNFMTEIEAKLLVGLDDSECDMLRTLLTKLYNNI